MTADLCTSHGAVFTGDVAVIHNQSNVQMTEGNSATKGMRQTLCSRERVACETYSAFHRRGSKMMRTDMRVFQPSIMFGTYSVLELVFQAAGAGTASSRLHQSTVVLEYAYVGCVRSWNTYLVYVDAGFFCLDMVFRLLPDSSAYTAGSPVPIISEA